jgi:hypothetical protein
VQGSICTPITISTPPKKAFAEQKRAHARRSVCDLAVQPSRLEADVVRMPAANLVAKQFYGTVHMPRKKEMHTIKAVNADVNQVMYGTTSS